MKLLLKLKGNFLENIKQMGPLFKLFLQSFPDCFSVQLYFLIVRIKTFIHRLFYNTCE